MTAVHQFIPTLAPRDAIGRHTLEIRRTLRAAGVDSDIYAFEAKGELRREVRPYRSFRVTRRGRSPTLIYHAAISSPIAGFLVSRPEPLIVDYHNVTPADFFTVWEPGLAKALALGRHQLTELRDRSPVAFADSEFNAAELREIGYARTEVLPILFDPADLRSEVDEAAATALEARHRGADWLFVGRLAPNKAQHELIKALAAYRHAYDPQARLRLVGASSSSHYETTLLRMIKAAGLSEAVQLVGSVSDGELAAHYATADVFVCLSDHEGFLVPLIEAMHHGLPIVAYARSAVPETMGDAGVALPHRDPATVAAAVHRVLEDSDLRSVLVARGHARLAQLSLERGRKRLLELLAAHGAL